MLALLTILLYCVVFFFALFCSFCPISCLQCCPCLWITHSWLPNRFSLMFIYLCGRNRISTTIYVLHIKTVKNLMLDILISKIMLTLIYRQQKWTQTCCISLQIVNIQIVIHIMYHYCYEYRWSTAHLTLNNNQSSQRLRIITIDMHVIG